MPLFFGETGPFCVNQVLGVARAVQFYGTGIGGERAMQDSSLKRGLDGYHVCVGLQAQMKPTCIETIVLDGVGAGTQKDKRVGAILLEKTEIDCVGHGLIASIVRMKMVF